MKNKFIKLSLLALVFSPLITFAAGLGSIMDTVTNLIGTNFIRLVFALAFAYFFWGVVQYVLYPDDEAKKEKGRQFMIWGIIALTVMFSVYGLISALQTTLTLDNDVLDAPSLPN